MQIACVLAITTRSLIYLQALEQQGLLPEHCIVLAENTEELYKLFDIKIAKSNYKYVNLDDTIGDLLQRNRVSYVVAGTKDMNSERVCELVKMLPEAYCIYSGYGGCILKKHLFELDKKWIHVHAGKLPDYRGSTTAYYSLIDKGFMSSTAIIMTPNLDDGDIICSLDFLPDTSVNIDYLFEPFTRAETLVQALKKCNSQEVLETCEQDDKNANTYYIIHPVLKHIAILGLKEGK